MGFEAQVGSGTLSAFDVDDVEGDVDTAFTRSKEIGISSGHGITGFALKRH
jgi:hypothetical protein